MYRFSLVSFNIAKRGFSQYFNGNARIWQNCKVSNSLLQKPRGYILKTFYSEDGRNKEFRPIINYMKKNEFKEIKHGRKYPDPIATKGTKKEPPNDPNYLLKITMAKAKLKQMETETAPEHSEDVNAMMMRDLKRIGFQNKVQQIDAKFVNTFYPAGKDLRKKLGYTSPKINTATEEVDLVVKEAVKATINATLKGESKKVEVTAKKMEAPTKKVEVTDKEPKKVEVTTKEPVTRPLGVALDGIAYPKVAQTVKDAGAVKPELKMEALNPSPNVAVLSNVLEKELTDVTSSTTSGNSSNDNSDGDKSWRNMKYTLMALGISWSFAMTYLLYVFASPKRDEDGVEIADQFSHLPIMQQFYCRALHELEEYKKMINEPSREKLLPDPLKPPYFEPPYTLVLELTDVLVHPEWTYSTGWRFKKRPGVDQFLELLYTRFEMVVYTAELGMTVFPILESLDTHNYITYKLVRDATNFIGGHHVKDLDKLNRDLSKVIVIDWNPDSTQMHKDNLFQIPKWDGRDDDRTLFDLVGFLTAISEWEVDDVRAVLNYYSQFENPLVNFKKRQMEILEAAN